MRINIQVQFKYEKSLLGEMKTSWINWHTLFSRKEKPDISKITYHMIFNFLRDYVDFENLDKTILISIYSNEQYIKIEKKQ